MVAADSSCADLSIAAKVRLQLHHQRDAMLPVAAKLGIRQADLASRHTGTRRLITVVMPHQLLTAHDLEQWNTPYGCQLGTWMCPPPQAASEGEKPRFFT